MSARSGFAQSFIGSLQKGTTWSLPTWTTPSSGLSPISAATPRSPTSDCGMEAVPTRRSPKSRSGRGIPTPRAAGCAKPWCSATTSASAAGHPKQKDGSTWHHPRRRPASHRGKTWWSNHQMPPLLFLTPPGVFLFLDVSVAEHYTGICPLQKLRPGEQFGSPEGGNTVFPGRFIRRSVLPEFGPGSSSGCYTKLPALPGLFISLTSRVWRWKKGK